MEFKYEEPINDFSNGLAVLKSYHEAFLKRGVRLLTLIEEIKQSGINETCANQCMEMYWHYQHANHLHHQDEEQALFPALLGTSALIDGMMERLLLDHEEIEKVWTLLEQQLSQPDKITDFAGLLALAKDFEHLQREHLTREDEDFLPKVKAILTTEQTKQIGGKMAELRNM